MSLSFELNRPGGRFTIRQGDKTVLRMRLRSRGPGLLDRQGP
jgi:hypothetical protein